MILPSKLLRDMSPDELNAEIQRLFNLGLWDHPEAAAVRIRIDEAYRFLDRLARRSHLTNRETVDQRGNEREVL